MIATRQMNVVLLADDPDKAEAMPAEQVPWVERRVFGRRAVWWATFKMSITRPSEIGRRIGPHTRWQDAYWYAYVAHLIAYGIISAIVSMLAVVMMLWFGDGSMSEFGTLLLVLFGLVVVAPLVVPLFMAAVHGSVAHVFLIWTGPRRGTFRHTASSLFYTEGLQIFVPLLVVPCVAPAVPYSAPVISYATLMVQLALAVWSIVISAYILKHAQQVGGVRAAIAAMLGSILTYALILVVGFVG